MIAVGETIGLHQREIFFDRVRHRKVCLLCNPRIIFAKDRGRWSWNSRKVVNFECFWLIFSFLFFYSLFGCKVLICCKYSYVWYNAKFARTILDKIKVKISKSKNLNVKFEQREAVIRGAPESPQHRHHIILHWTVVVDARKAVHGKHAACNPDACSDANLRMLASETIFYLWFFCDFSQIFWPLYYNTGSEKFNLLKIESLCYPPAPPRRGIRGIFIVNIILNYTKWDTL